MPTPEFPEVLIEGRAAWRMWLAAHHQGAGAVWLNTDRKGRGPYPAYDKVVEEALCFG